ncbi:hypothetical protein DFR65_10189 [Oceanihabitans sediminis]|uniref:SGNH/GDSL hydrolase family protein n=1 Tax=Oceanihabitans sediminis TaxID=1812012 RepID=A0A368P4T5_9FLAO|nr:SGNH/GDSL hydrolase family protein [Oceanihabitans sediminis]MDX1772557.1 SGNH/GDSL hydrolase family protein [Oceanihabitans sediminis]RBP34206.1 hypothetical protein DFR65_10189 [Oceanihabitans sediminis]RCU57897.1 SGNH/GDSL hydrolase family protein [Oceanihabitans sediminis]
MRSINKNIYLICIVFISFICGFSQQTSLKDTTNKEVSILFIGNSLTYTNNLPQLVKDLAKKQKIEVAYKMLALPNYSLEDHWTNGTAQELITKNQYDFVIVQQGPSSQIKGREMLLEYGEKFQSICKPNNAKLCFLMVWPSLTYYHTFENVIKNYSLASKINNAILLPVGLEWKNHFGSTNDFQYYGADGFHPSLKGSKETAKIIVKHLLLKS